MSITILHTNDLHGFVRSVPRLAKSVQDKRAQLDNVLFADVGDFFRLKRHRRPQEDDRVTAWTLRSLEYDIVTPGNAELSRFDPWHLDFLIAQNCGAMLCTSGFNARLPASCRPYRVFTIDGLRILFIGICTEDSHWDLSTPANNFYPSARRSAAKTSSLVNAFRDKVDMVIVLSHSGMAQDILLAEHVPEIDLILSGHCHHPTLRPITIGKTRIVQAGLNGMFLGQVDIAPGSGGPEIEATMHTIDANTPEDTVMERLLRLQGRRNDSEKMRIIGMAGENIGQGYLSSNGLGNTVTDIWRQATGADIAWTKATFITPLFSPGHKLTSWDIQLCVRGFPLSKLLTLTGKQIQQALEHSVADQSYAFLPPDRRDELVRHLEGASALPGCNFLHQSGMQVKVDLTQPTGERVLEIHVGDKPLDPDGTYRVAMDAFHARGGSAFTMLADAQKREDLNLDNPVEAHVREVGLLDGTVDDRYQIVGATAPAAMA
jgi:2',3'-cyclic-nucleotide 2'-phosphodiesterase (5'-nucleotidase family)